jgi:hypothetical protein
MAVATAFQPQRRPVSQPQRNIQDAPGANHPTAQATMMATIGDGEWRRADVAAGGGAVALPRNNRLFILAEWHLVALWMVVGQLLQPSFQPRRLNLGKVAKLSPHLDKVSVERPPGAVVRWRWSQGREAVATDALPASCRIGTERRGMETQFKSHAINDGWRVARAKRPVATDTCEGPHDAQRHFQLAVAADER